MTTITPEEIENFRSQLVDYPEALAALDEIEEDEGDLEYATEIIALKAGVEKSRKNSWLEDLSKRSRNIICQDEFREHLVEGVINGVLIEALAAVIPMALAAPVAIYAVKIGVKNFCKATDNES